MSPREWDAHYRKQAAFAKEAAACISYHERKHAAEGSRARAERGATTTRSNPDELVRTAERLEREDDARVREMLRLNDDRNKAVADMARLAYLLTHLGGGAGRRGTVAGKSRVQGTTQAQDPSRSPLEASFVDDDD